MGSGSNEQRHWNINIPSFWKEQIIADEYKLWSSRPRDWQQCKLQSVNQLDKSVKNRLLKHTCLLSFAWVVWNTHCLLSGTRSHWCFSSAKWSDCVMIWALRHGLYFSQQSTGAKCQSQGKTGAYPQCCSPFTLAMLTKARNRHCIYLCISCACVCSRTKMGLVCTHITLLTRF